MRQRIEKAAEASKARYDQKARATPSEIGQRVLLQRTGFRDRHKLKDHYYSDSYIVTNCNEERTIYEIRTAMGGPSKWVNRKMLVADPRGVESREERPDILPGLDAFSSDEDSVSEQGEDPWLITFNPEEEANEEIPLDQVVDPQDVLEEPQPGPRRSARLNKGHHNNPTHEPRSVITQNP